MSAGSIANDSTQQPGTLMGKLRGPVGKVENAWGVIAMLKNWPTAFRNWVDRNSDGGSVTYNLRSGLRFTLSAGSMDVVTLLHVIQSRIYEPTEEFRIKNGWNVLDLGAHKGVFSIHAAQAGADTRILSIEPEPRNYSFLEKNLERNNVTNVTTENAAVWSERGEFEFSVRDSLDHSLMNLNRGVSSSTVRTKSVTLDELVERVGGNVDLVKMDIEGAEHSVLRSASPETLRSIRRIALEFHSVPPLDADEVASDIEATLERHGFRHFRTPELPDQLFAVSERDHGGDR